MPITERGKGRGRRALDEIESQLPKLNKDVGILATAQEKLDTLNAAFALLAALDTLSSAPEIQAAQVAITGNTFIQQAIARCESIVANPQGRVTAMRSAIDVINTTVQNDSEIPAALKTEVAAMKTNEA